MKSVVIIVVSYNSRKDICNCLESLQRTVCDELILHTVVVDNASSDDTCKIVRKRFPCVQVLALPRNVGYGEGANCAWRAIRNENAQFEYVSILNQDVVVDPFWLQPLLDTLEKTTSIAIAQPQILLRDRPDRINTLGLRCHYLGFSSVVGCGEPMLDRSDHMREITAASGAALMIRTAAIQGSGAIFESDLFMYQEDVELSWSVRCWGYSCQLVPASIVYHEYDVNAWRSNYFRLERNRLMLVLTHYPTWLILQILPTMLLMEVAQLLWTLPNGLFLARLRIYRELFHPKRIYRLWQRRRRAKQSDTILSEQIISRFESKIEIRNLSSHFLVNVADHAFSYYWKSLKLLHCVGCELKSRLSNSKSKGR